MFGKKADEVAAKLAERFGVELDESGPSDDEDGDDFAVDLGGNTGPTLRPLISLMDDATRREEVSDQPVEVCEGTIEVERDKRDGTRTRNPLQSGKDRKN